MSLLYLLSSSGMAVYSSPKLHQAGAPPPPFFGFAALSKKENLVRRAKFSSIPNYSWSLDGGGEEGCRAPGIGVLILTLSKKCDNHHDKPQFLSESILHMIAILRT